MPELFTGVNGFLRDRHGKFILYTRLLYYLRRALELRHTIVYARQLFLAVPPLSRSGKNDQTEVITGRKSGRTEGSVAGIHNESRDHLHNLTLSFTFYSENASPRRVLPLPSLPLMLLRALFVLLVIYDASGGLRLSRPRIYGSTDLRRSGDATRLRCVWRFRGAQWHR